jgi:hypothetical protein
VLSRRSLLSMLREDGIRMALSRCPVIRFPFSEERGDIKRFGNYIHVSVNSVFDGMVRERESDLNHNYK